MEFLKQLKLPDDIKNLNYDELKKLAAETRQLIIEVCAKNGGHIAPSLGVVELTLSLLKNFDPLHDRIIWDVGHQSYAYKILTDRLERFHTLRQFKGISGFNKPSESPYDAFGVGHTSTSVSAALGIRMADEIIGKKRKIVAIIGDGALTAGLAFEGLNNLGHLDKDMIVILNDNEMSISKNVGAISSYLSRAMTGEFYTHLRKDVQNILEHAPLGDKLLKMAKKFEEGLKGLFTPGILFEELGLKYIGPIDGHDLKELDKAIHNAKIQDGPTLIHVITKKGKGFKPAEENPEKFHGVSSFDIETGKPIKFKGKTFTEVFGDALLELAKQHDNIVAITAAMKPGTGLNKFAETFPERFFDVGIAEQHAVTFAAGLAISGCKPYVAIYSTFLQRAYDQIIHDVALQNLPVIFCIDRAGLVGADGPTHHGSFDISYLRTVPNIHIMLPKDEFELIEMLKLSYELDAPVAIRYPRGDIKVYDLPKIPVTLYEPEVINDSGEILIISAGHIFDEVFEAYNNLKNKFSVALLNLRFLKPLNIEKILEIAKNKKMIITVEENSVNGGVGDEILSILAENNVYPEKFIKLGIPDRFIEHGSVKELRKLIRLDAKSIEEKIISEWEKID
ncbi:1-deoxy-D-xylulose-5-phosphate synthase [Deferribacter autotrophicus]|uniref:1-deoxy-D-xylulose-5-phosphate synthase n=1 Tax=Deferribacter autotrophicus TaxID=500465 RepID=A0A5A8F507_9BACT|nr:1-deoxy-D-xylulose-5-phosphate synthase [Deferribacter autotrophicus]KAA0259161.1 1-deoxy-D-xylulose-5-phosphate synthase [Deferribacter autotrophicus]